MKNMINWVEIPAADFNRAVTFYEQLYGVQMHKTEMYGTQMGFFPSEQGSVSGAVVKGDDYTPGSTGPLVYLSGGDDLQQVLDKIEAAGGKVLVPKTQITPELGNFAIFTDTEGNRMALHSMN